MAGTGEFDATLSAASLLAVSHRRVDDEHGSCDDRIISPWLKGQHNCWFSKVQRKRAVSELEFLCWRGVGTYHYLLPCSRKTDHSAVHL